MSIVEIYDVSLFELDVDRLWAYNIECPSIGSCTEAFAVDIGGWVFGRGSAAFEVEVVQDDQVIRRVPLTPRPDVAAVHPTLSGSDRCGFATSVGVLGMAPEFELLLQVVREDESRVPLATLRGRHQRLRSGFQPKLQPLMITSWGRTGTTLLMRILLEDSRIISQQSYPYESRPAVYWMHMLKVLSEPANPYQSSHVDSFAENIYTIGHHPYYFPEIVTDREILHRFEHFYPQRLAAFSQQCIEDFYDHLAGVYRRSGLAYFAEKMPPSHIPWLMWEIYPEAREVIMVRDFRDMFCSMLAFNTKRGFASFGRERTQTDEEFIDLLRLGALRLLQSWKQRSASAHLVRYEDLIQRPMETVTALLEYLDLPATSADVMDLIRRASSETPELMSHRTSPDSEASIGRWRHELDDSLQSLCNKAFGDILREFAYSGDGQW
jgi:hypothetical protein